MKRVGVFVCHCGKNIAGVVDVKEVMEYAKTLPGVVTAQPGKVRVYLVAHLDEVLFLV